MDAFSVASEILGRVELSPGQLAQLRAINHKYQQRLFTLMHESPAAGQAGVDNRPAAAGANREPAPDELTELRSMLVGDIRDMLSPDQRRQIDPG